MVCQAASQTRFRALKHENGIAGSATIIVRVIACFQPLQDCQVSGNNQLLLLVLPFKQRFDCPGFLLIIGFGSEDSFLYFGVLFSFS